MLTALYVYLEFARSQSGQGRRPPFFLSFFFNRRWSGPAKPMGRVVANENQQLFMNIRIGILAYLY